MQTEKIYMISDAAKNVKVEAHVLRYWEEELQLPVKRNEMGHRFYTEEDIRQFQHIKELKDQGLQLKAIRSVLKGEVGEFGKRHVLMVKKGEVLPVNETSVRPVEDKELQETRAEKSLRLQQLLHSMIADAVQSNNQEICQEIVQEVKNSVLKELDYQFRLQEEREDEREAGREARSEEHYKQLDSLLRNYSHKKKQPIWEKIKGKREIPS